MFSLPLQWGYHCSTPQIFQVRPHPQHTCTVVSQPSDRLWDATSWHTSTILRYRSTVSQAHCLSHRLSQSYLSSFEGQKSQMSSHSWERHTRSSPLSHQRKKQGNLWNWEQNGISVLPEDKGSGRRPDAKIATKTGGRRTLLLDPSFRGTCPWAPELLDWSELAAVYPTQGQEAPLTHFLLLQAQQWRRRKGLQPSYLLNS